MPSSFSKTDAPAAGRPLPDWVVIGRVIGVRGLRGELVVEVLSDVAGRFERGARCTLALPGGGRREAEIVATGAHPRGVIVRIEGVADRDAALALRGSTLEIPRPVEAARAAGTVFEYELVGCVCVDATAGELGVLEEVEENGGGLLLRIVNTRSVLLVPFVESFVERIDVGGRRVLLRLPEGLVDACGSRS
jgi:16S rRNA processing protein RimM